MIFPRTLQDGRVNGGLNLSRAIGDHAYKKNDDLGPKDQMITALPDVRTAELDPETDEFMILACDGIWWVRFKFPFKNNARICI